MQLRPVDLARVAGISAQQVRNYLDAGVLPPAERSPAGYRMFDERHRQALVTYRALGRGYGWDAARSIMRAIHAGSPALALARIDAVHAAVHEQRQALRATAEALEAVAGHPPDTVPRTGLRVGELAARLGIRPSALRVWETAGLLAPKRDTDHHRRYGPTDVRDARLVATLRQSRYPLPVIKPIMDQFRSSGGTEALRDAITAREADLTRQAMAMLEAATALHGYLPRD
ncbi:MerR family transcriptional regulator [Saccharothrix deserti]|uniref:MerR family transcriptional regulator n=1 Tax=Saccharothrix deserti TaxID=2593674 RepID=UPI001EE48C13|nr:MerR family transcriptional regulator [Saccharothrix deserti]